MKIFKILLILFLAFELINANLSAMVDVRQKDMLLVDIFTEKIKSSEGSVDSQAFPLDIIKSMIGHIKSSIGDPEKIIRMRQILFEVPSQDVDLMISNDTLLKLLKEIKVIQSVHMIDLSDLESTQRVKKIIILALWDYSYYVCNRVNH